MKNILLWNNKGVSEIVSYVILVIIAISIGALVYNYLGVLVPKDRPVCQDGVSLTLESYTCDGESLNLTLKNRGRFNIDAAYIRVGQENKNTKFWINNELSNKFEFGAFGPGELYAENYSLPEDLDLTNNILEIQIAMYDEETKTYAACDQIITQPISC